MLRIERLAEGLPLQEEPGGTVLGPIKPWQKVTVLHQAGTTSVGPKEAAGLEGRLDPELRARLAGLTGQTENKA